MFIVDSEQALVDAFRPRDRATLQLPQGVKFPRFVRDYLAWTDPSGFHVFLLFAIHRTAPIGIAFRRTRSAVQPPVGHLCDFCHCPGTSDGVGLLTADRNSKKRVGINVCLDLRCKEKLEDAANRGGKNALEAQRQLLQKIGRFAHEALGIDLTGAGRNQAPNLTP